jgi:hypothetical protein
MKNLINYLHKENKLAFYMDLHSHAAKKGMFVFGNAIEDFSQ